MSLFISLLLASVLLCNLNGLDMTDAVGLSSGPGSSKLGFRTTAAIIFGRLVLVPPAGLGIVTVADKLGFIPKGDQMFKFVLLLQHTMPTSVLSGNFYHWFLRS